MPVSVELTNRYVLVRELDECTQRQRETIARLLTHYDSDDGPSGRTELVSVFVVGEFDDADDVSDAMLVTEADHIIKTALGRQ